MNSMRNMMPPSLISTSEPILAVTSTRYEEDELNDSSTHRTSSSASFDDIDASTHEFWNMTLDDHLADAAPTVPTRRASDGGIRTSRFRSSSKKKSLPRRNVSFDKVKVRVCERVLGDNPCCSKSGGPSLSIGWNYHPEEQVVELDVYEKKRTKEGRRSYEKLQLSPAKREKIAKKQGYTKAEIQANIEQVAKCQRRRDRTRKEVEKEELANEICSNYNCSSCNGSNNNKKAALKRFLQAEQRPSSSSSSSSSRSKTSTSTRRSSTSSITTRSSSKSAASTRRNSTATSSSRDSAATALNLPRSTTRAA